MRASGEAEAAVNILDAVIRSRKSIRAFKSEPVPRRLLTEIVDAARSAPSNYNSQPWRVYSGRLRLGKRRIRSSNYQFRSSSKLGHVWEQRSSISHFLEFAEMG